MLKKISILIALALLLAVAALPLCAQQMPAAEEEKGKAPDANAGRMDDAPSNQPQTGKANPKQEASEPPLVTKPERIPVNVLLNSQKLGDQIVVMMPEGDMLVPPKILPFREPPPQVDFEGEPHVSLRALAPRLSFELDLRTLELIITAQPKLFKTYVVDFAAPPPDYSLAEPAGAYLNYAIGYSMGPDDEFVAMSLPWEVAVRMLGGSAFSSFFTSRVKSADPTKGTVENSARVNSHITWDFPAGPSSLVVGDVSGVSGPLGGGTQMGGIRFSRNYNLTPYFTFHQRLRLSGVADSPSEVTVLIDGRYRERHDVPPGEFDLRNISGAEGLGTASLIVKDAFGREKRYDSPFFVSTQLLRPGLHEFDYSLGSRRIGQGTDSNEYGSTAFTGFHRYGISRFLSAALSVEAGVNKTFILDSNDEETIEEHDVINGGVSATFGFGKFGQLNLDTAYSREEQDPGEEPLLGRASAMSYSLAAGFLSFGVSGQSFTPRYATLSLGAAQTGKTGRAWSGTIGVSLGFLGLGSASQSQSDNFDGSQVTATSLSYSLSLGGGISLSAGANRFQSIDADGEETESISLTGGILMSLGDHNLSMGQQTDQTGSVTRTASLQKNASEGAGYGYRVTGQRTTQLDESESQSGDARLDYSGPFGVYSVAQRRSVSFDSDGNTGGISRGTDFTAAGGFALIGGAVHHTRPVSDGFALVRVAGIEGVRVFSNNQEFGKTDEDGEAVVSNLASYLANRLSFQSDDVPVDFSFEVAEKLVALPTRSGTVVNFDINRIQAFIGQAFFVEKGKKTPAEFAGLFYQVRDAPVESTVGRDGEFYLENLPAGTYPALLRKEKQECRFELVIPGSTEVMVDLGEVYCEINKN